MRIELAELFLLEYGSPGNEIVSASRRILLRLGANGISGWGEAVLGKSPTAEREWAGACFLTLREWLAPAVVGQFIDTAETLQERIRGVQGWPAAKYLIDMAWWDLDARRRGVPLWQVLGGSAVPRVDAALTPIRDVAETVRLLKSIVEQGCAGVTLRTGPGEDVHVLRLVRQEFPSLVIRVDGGQRYRLEHRDHLLRLADFQVAALQQPLAEDDLVGHAMLKSALSTPICLAESISSAARLEQAIDLESAQSVALDVVRLGGITPTRDIAAACRVANLSCLVIVPSGSPLTQRVAIAMARSAGAERLIVPIDDVASEAMGGPASPLFERKAQSGLCPILWDEPGVGIDPDPKKDSERIVDHAIIG